MPFVHIRITRDGTTVEQKAELIRAVTEQLERVLGKNPATTSVIIEEVDAENWGAGGRTVAALRQAAAR